MGRRRKIERKREPKMMRGEEERECERSREKELSERKSGKGHPEEARGRVSLG